MFERKISDNVALSYSEKLRLIVGELEHAPLMCAFWSIVALLHLDRKETETFEVSVPTPQGLLLGNMSPIKMNMCELRTFVPNEQLFTAQKKLRDEMLLLSQQFSDSDLPFYLMSVTKDIKIDHDQSVEMLAAGASVLLSTGHADLIPQ
jgi:hypothetical protein